MRRTIWSFALLTAPILAGCPESAPASRADAAASAVPAAAPETRPVASASAAPSASSATSDAGRDAAEPPRFNPKYKCPTGMTHFYLEGDFCRKKCFSASDCGKGERCSGMEYPYVVDGKPAGSGRFCEGF